MLSIILWMALHRFVLIMIALILTVGSLALFVYKRFENQGGLRWGAVGITLLFWLGSIYVTAWPANMSSFTHLETVGQYQYKPTTKAELAKTDAIKVTDGTGKQIVFPHIDEYTIKTQKNGLANNQIIIKHRVINKNATKLQREYFKKVAPRSFANGDNTSRGQLIFNGADK
jgi:hypothetical protein